MTTFNTEEFDTGCKSKTFMLTFDQPQIKSHNHVTLHSTAFLVVESLVRLSSWLEILGMHRNVKYAML